MMNMATITATELAAELGTTGREVRKFLRADAKVNDQDTPGKGSRYAIERKQVAGLKKRFADWDTARKVKVEATDAPVDSDEAHPDDTPAED